MRTELEIKAALIATKLAYEKQQKLDENRKDLTYMRDEAAFYHNNMDVLRWILGEDTDFLCSIMEHRKNPNKKALDQLLCINHARRPLNVILKKSETK
jgi:hypothetical protein